MLTDNKILVEKLRQLPALMCTQRRADKRISTEEDFIQSNIDSFGNEIGQTTNWITSMFEVQSHFSKDSKEYNVLDYRIKCGQLYQQNAIDKAKGIVCKPMPKSWHDRHAAGKIEDPAKKSLYKRIVADRKPYFMIYIYPSLMKQYNKYIKDTHRKALSSFKMTVSELEEIPYNRLTDQQKDFLHYYELCMPVGKGNCVMNKICKRFEDEFDGHTGRWKPSKSFDYNIYKSGVQYNSSKYYSIKKLCEQYNNLLCEHATIANKEDKRTKSEDANNWLRSLNESFIRECSEVCPNEDSLCDILLDLCYSKHITKRMVWGICGTTIIKNLLSKNQNTITFPVIDPDGTETYAGEKFSVIEKEVVDVNNIR